VKIQNLLTGYERALVHSTKKERDAEEDFEFSHHANIYAGSRMSGQIDALACTPPARILVFLMKFSVQKI
jgi:hypothetical protein